MTGTAINNTNMKHLLVRASALSLSLLLFAGCQQDGAATSAPVTDDIPVPVRSAPAEQSNAITQISEDVTITDADDDGIPDETDPYPEQAPDSALTLDVTLQSVRGSESEPVRLRNTVIAGQQTTVMLSATDDGTPMWLQWRGEGKVWSDPVQPGLNTLDVPEIKVQQVAVIRDNSITAPMTVDWYSADEPLIYPPADHLQAGDILTLYGEHLSQITRMRIGGHQIEPLPLGDGVLSLTLPPLPDTPVMSWHSEQAGERQMLLDLYRQVTLTPDTELEASGWLTIRSDGIAHLDEQPEIAVPAGQPLRIYFTHPERSSTLAAQIWPDQSEVAVGAASTLESWLLQLLDSHGLAGTDWRRNRARLPDIADFSDLLTLLNHEQNGNAAPGAATDRYAAYLAAGITWTPEHLLTLQGIFAGTDPLFEQLVTVSNQRGIPGSKTFADISIARKDHIFCLQLPWEAEQVPSDAWPSDLCVDNDTPVYASVGALDQNGKRLRTHQINEYFDKDMVGPKGFGMFGISSIAYLTTDSGDPLCRMQPCTVDFITGGFGLLATDDLPPQYQDEYAYIAVRTLVEKVIIEMIATATGTASDKSSPAFCLATEMLDKRVGGVTMMSTFLDAMQKIRGANTDQQKFNILSETVLKFGLEYIVGVAVAGAQGATDCFTSSAARQAAMGSAKSAVSGSTRLVGKLAIPLKVADAVTKAVDQWNIYTKPKYITFKVEPKAEVTDVRTPYVSVLSADDVDGTLEIEGCHITNQKVDGSGNPDAAYDYFPEVVFTDSRGRTATLQTNSTHRRNMADLCKSRLVLSALELSNTLGSMKSGSIRTALKIRLPYDTAAFNGFPESKLPVPGKSFQWSGPVILNGTRDGYLNTGLVNTLTGTNLLALKNKPLVIYLQQGTDVTRISEVQYRDEEIDFFVPIALPDGDYSLTLISDEETGEGATLAHTLSVAPPALSYLTVTDRGVKKDDGFYIDLTDSQFHELEVVATPVRVALAADSQKRSNSGYFNGSGIVTRSGEAIAPPLTLYLFCDEGGTDGYCTWGVNAKVVLPDGSTHLFKEAGKLKKGDSVYISES